MRERVFSIVIEISALEKQLSMLENETIPNVTELSRRVKEDGVTIKRLRDNNQILIVELEEKRNTLFEMQENVRNPFKPIVSAELNSLGFLLYAIVEQKANAGNSIS